MPNSPGLSIVAGTKFGTGDGDAAAKRFFRPMLNDRLLRHVMDLSLADAELPPGVGVLDPLHGPHGTEVRRIVTAFHRTYFSDDRPRTLMLGINPGRLGAGSTGLSFTDTKRCESDLGIPVRGLRTHEPCSDFFYRMVRAAGGAAAFYCRVYVHAIMAFFNVTFKHLPQKEN